MTLNQLQHRIRELYGEKDARRGVDGTFMWFMEEVGELSSALRCGTPDEQVLEFADVLAWLVTLANCAGVDLEEAVQKLRPVEAPIPRTQSPRHLPIRGEVLEMGTNL